MASNHSAIIDKIPPVDHKKKCGNNVVFNLKNLKVIINK